MRFPLQVVAKSRTPEEQVKYYRWVNFVTGREPYYGKPIWGPVVGWRTRWFHTFMDGVPHFIWRRLPVKWQTAHLFGDPTE